MPEAYSDSQWLVEMRGIAKRFGQAEALRDVDFRLRAGEVHALLGENGAGKSTLMKILMGVHRADHGTVLLRGEDITSRSIGDKLAGGIAMIFQELSLLPNLTVADNLLLGREPRRPLWMIDRAALRGKAQALLDEYDFPIRAGIRVERLGFAQRQMVEIVKAAASGARVLIMDEPTSSLTIHEQEKLFAIIQTLKRRDIGIIYISHRMSEIFRVSDRISVIRDGRMLPTERIANTTPRRIAQMMSRAPHQGTVPVDMRPGPVQENGAPALKVSGLRTSSKFPNGLDLTIERGEIVGIAGLVGSGRSALAKAIFGLLPDVQGEIEVGGQAIRTGSPKAAIAAGIGFVPEDRRHEGLVVDHSLSDNVALARLGFLRPRGRWPFLRPRAGDAIFRHFRRELGIVSRSPRQLARELSGGNQQKIVVAKWLATEPKLLILDEPTSGVDVNAKEEMRVIIRRAADAGLGVLLIASEMEELTRMADRIVTMADGRLGTTLPAGASEEDLRNALQIDIDAARSRSLQ